MWQVFKNSQGSVILRGKLRDTTTGNGKTALTIASSGLIISTIADNEATPVTYTQAGSTIETIATLGTYAAPTATKCRFKLVDNTNHPGIYEIQIADARFAVAGAKSLLVSVSGVSGLFDMDGLVPLQTVDPFVTGGKAPVTLASTDVTGNVAADVQTIKTQAVTCAGGVTVPAATLASTTNITAGTITTVTTLTNAPSDEAGVTTLLARLTSTRAGYIDNLSAGAVALASGVTVATNSDKTGYALSSAGLDQLAVTDPGAPASMTTIPKMIVAMWRWFYAKTTLTSTQLKTYAADNTTVNATAAVSDDGTTQTKGTFS